MNTKQTFNWLTPLFFSFALAVQANAGAPIGGAVEQGQEPAQEQEQAQEQQQAQEQEQAQQQAPAQAQEQEQAQQQVPAQGQEQAQEQGQVETPVVPAESKTAILAKLHVLNPMEIEAGRLAETKACSQDVKDLGRMIADDHEANETNLAALAEARNADLSDAGFSAEEQAAVEAQSTTAAQLASITDCSFDRAFLEAMRDGHLFAMTMVREAADAETTDTELRAFLEATYGSMHGHYGYVLGLLAATPASPADLE